MESEILSVRGSDLALFSAGDNVYALYIDGTKYPATIKKVYRSKLQYLVDWEDGDSNHRAVPFEDVSARPTKRVQVSHVVATVKALSESSQNNADGNSKVDEPAGHRKPPAPLDKVIVENKENDETRWNSDRLAQLCAQVERLPVKCSMAYWSQVADGMEREHNMRNVQPGECQQAYTSRYPTPLKRRRKKVGQKQQEMDVQSKRSGVLSTEVAARHHCNQAVSACGAEPDDGQASLQLNPAPQVPRPGTIKWKSYVRAVLAESDRNHVDDIFVSPNEQAQGEKESICSTSAITAAQAAAAADGFDWDPSDQDGDREDEHDFLTVLTEQQRRNMDGYLALLQRRDRSGSVFRRSKSTGKARHASHHSH